MTRPDGTPVHATCDGTVKVAGLGNGYGRMVVIDHGQIQAHGPAHVVLASRREQLLRQLMDCNRL